MALVFLLCLESHFQGPSRLQKGLPLGPLSQIFGVQPNPIDTQVQESDGKDVPNGLERGEEAERSVGYSQTVGHTDEYSYGT